MRARDVAAHRNTTPQCAQEYTTNVHACPASDHIESLATTRAAMEAARADANQPAGRPAPAHAELDAIRE
eukprot:2678304-Pleurochrysis_carterae.AAC.1